MEIRVTRSVLDSLFAEAGRTAPDECCGMLLGRNGQIDEARPAANVAENRRRRFEIDPQALIDAHRAARRGGPQILGYFHSHPEGSAEPSKIDRALAVGDGLVWAIMGETSIGEPGVTFWRDEEWGFVPLSYTTADR